MGFPRNNQRRFEIHYSMECRSRRRGHIFTILYLYTGIADMDEEGSLENRVGKAADD